MQYLLKNAVLQTHYVIIYEESGLDDNALSESYKSVVYI